MEAAVARTPAQAGAQESREGEEPGRQRRFANAGVGGGSLMRLAGTRESLLGIRGEWSGGVEMGRVSDCGRLDMGRRHLPPA